MQVIISPPVERVVTVTMTLSQARDLVDRYYNAYGSATSAISVFPGERSFAALLIALKKVINSVPK